MFSSLHQNNYTISDLQFRLRLLKFAILYTRRFVPDQNNIAALDLHRLRGQNHDRMATFSTQADPMLMDGPVSFPAEDLQPDPANFPDGRKERPPSRDARSSNQTPLLDIIPTFMTLSATQKQLQESSVTDTWMRLAAGFMAQAVAEQILIYQSQTPKILQEAFAWGFDPGFEGVEGSEEWLINAMFYGEENEPITEWERIRDEHKGAVCMNRRMVHNEFRG